MLYKIAPFILLVSFASAASISISGTSVYEPDESTLLSENSYISVGYFDNTFSAFSGLSSRTWADINSADYIEVFNSFITPAGEASGSGSATGILGTKLYAWVFDVTSAPASVSGQAYGLFSSTASNWLATGDNFLTDFNFLDVADIDESTFGSVVAGGVSLAVPEPSTYAAITGVLALGFAFFRRRRA